MYFDEHPPTSPLLRRKDASRYLMNRWGVPTAPRTLAKLAVAGGGPPFRKFGPWPLYDRADLDAWVNAKLGPKQNSTSDSPIPTHQKRSNT